MYGRAYWIFLSRGRSTPAMRAIAYPCRCRCLGFRLQMTRITPRRLITLQCSQIGLTLERTFNRWSPGKNCGLVRNYSRGRKCTQGAELGAAAHLGQLPLTADNAKSQEQGFPPHVPGADHRILALQLHEPVPRGDLAHAAQL